MQQVETSKKPPKRRAKPANKRPVEAAEEAAPAPALGTRREAEASPPRSLGRASKASRLSGGSKSVAKDRSVCVPSCKLEQTAEVGPIPRPSYLVTRPSDG